MGRGLAQSWDQLRSNDLSVRALVDGIYRAVAITGWLLLAVLAVRLLAAPEVVVEGLLRAIRAHLVIAVGLLIIRASVAIVDTLEEFSHRYSQERGWRHYYDHLRPLVPMFRACFEYALWVVLASLVLVQLGAGRLAIWRPSLVEAIGIFFLSRVVIELGRLEIGRRLP